MYFDLIIENFLSFTQFITKTPILFIIMVIVGFLMSLLTGIDKYYFSWIKWIIGMVLLVIGGLVILIRY